MTDPIQNGRTSGREGPRGLEDKPRGEDHLERARRRVAEVRASLGDGDSDADVYIDKWYAEAPPGWTYEWKTHSVWNKEYPQYMTSLLRTGWSPVPASRHRDLVYPGYTDENILVDGMILMERPKELTDRIRRREQVKAFDQVRHSEAKLSEAPPGTAPRNVNPKTFPSLSSHVGPIIPE